MGKKNTDHNERARQKVAKRARKLLAACAEINRLGGECPRKKPDEWDRRMALGPALWALAQARAPVAATVSAGRVAPGQHHSIPRGELVTADAAAPVHPIASGEFRQREAPYAVVIEAKFGESPAQLAEQCAGFGPELADKLADKEFARLVATATLANGVAVAGWPELR